MRGTLPTLGAFALLVASLATASLSAEPEGPAGMPPPVISSQQIDRFEAIRQLEQSTQQNPKEVADWIMLGELSHEVALDAPAEHASKYFHMSSAAYEKALALQPNNAGLKAAVKFAEDQEADAQRFEQARRQATKTYLDARRRDLAETNYTPTVRVSAPPMPSRNTPPAATEGNTTTTATAPPATVPAAVDPSAPVYRGAQPVYSYPAYQPYAPTQGAPYTYQQYSNASYPPNYYSNPAAQPMTAQRYMQQYPRSMMNSAEQQLLRGAIRPR